MLLASADHSRSGTSKGLIFTKQISRSGTSKGLIFTKQIGNQMNRSGFAVSRDVNVAYIASWESVASPSRRRRSPPATRSSRSPTPEARHNRTIPVTETHHSCKWLSRQRLCRDNDFPLQKIDFRKNENLFQKRKSCSASANPQRQGTCGHQACI